MAAYDEFAIKYDTEKLKQLVTENNKNYFFFACVNEKPIGFISFYECFTLYHAEKGLYVAGAFIEADYRGNGYGKKLFEFTANFAKENHYAYLNWIVEYSNQKAFNFYKSLNAQISDRWAYVRLNT